MKIYKFGGTSVGTVERMKHVAELISESTPKIVVLSATAGTTNHLEEIAANLFNRDIEQAHEKITRMEFQFIDFANELLTDESTKREAIDYILDLQGNGGGYLNAAIDLANEFLGQKELIVYTEGRTAKRSDFYAKGNGDFRNGRLIILVDEYTASASEIVSGAVQDWDRGIIVGRRSFGKGLVQRPIDLPDGSMIRLTIARYYTPSGRSIQKPYDSTVDYNKDLIERFNHGELMNADSIHFPDSLKVQTKKLGRTVYGGGGIMPDYFVPIDTTLYTDYHRNLVAKGAVIKFTMQFIEGHRKELKNKYKKFESFDEKFVVDDDMLATLKEIGEKEGVKFNEEQYQKSLPLIKTQLKALIARDLWDMNEYFRVMNTTNESIQKALEILNSDEYQKKLK